MNDVADPSPNLRNVPIQARSRDRLQKVLDAAETVLAKEGSAALTTTRVADVAGTSVGSLYHYFPDKDAIVVALAIRYWSDFHDLAAGVAESDEHELLDDPGGAIIDALAAGFRARPGFRALWYGGLRTESVRDATRAVRVEFAREIDGMLERRWPEADVDVRQSTARMVVLIGDGLLREAFRIDDEGDATLLDETKLVLRAYLAERLGVPR